MRKRLAEILAALSAIIVIFLAAVFSFLHNAQVRNDTLINTQQVMPQSQTSLHNALGRNVYNKLGCSGCHSVGGQGNPRVPLDGVGQRRSPEELHDWIIAGESVRPQLSASVVRMKQSYASIPEEEFQELLDYLTSLRVPSEQQ